MIKKMILALVTSAFLLVSAGVSADPVTVVFNCELNDDKTKEDAMAVNAKWLKWSRGIAGTDEITSSFVSTVMGDLGGFMWVDTYPDLATWAKVTAADDDEEISAAFDAVESCSRTSMYQGEDTVAAK